MADEFQLSKTIIHRIQSLLTPEQAARTCILSKSWQAAWLTRPNLEFDESDFVDWNFLDWLTGRELSGLGALSCLDELSEFAKTTYQRYAKANQKIESFRLNLDSGGRREIVDPIGLSDEMIVKDLRLGATRLDLCLTGKSDWKHILPHDVLEAENLVELAVKGYKIYDQVLVRCLKLESLSLEDVQIKRGLISCIASTCPLIKNLYLSNVWEWDRTKRCPESIFDGLTILPMLTSLVLCDVKVDALFLGDLSSKFPNLKDLTLQLCDLDEEMRISSCSLERLDFKHHGHLMTVLDVPRIRKFKFNGSVVPELGFQSASKDWDKSRITISCSDFRGPMFGELSKLLTELSQSKIYLSLKVFIKPPLFCNYEIEGLERLPCRHQVEHLMVKTDCHLPSLTSYAFYDGLFRICRPKLVTQHQGSKLKNSNNDFLSKILQQGTQGKFLYPCNFFYGLHDLEEVHVQPVDHDERQKVEFQLKWRPLP